MSSFIPTTMKAVQLVEFRSRPGFQVRNIPVPKIGSNDVLVKIGAAGFCHTDYQVWEGAYKSPLPIVPSHEPVGTVVAVGLEVNGKFKIGDRVGVLLFRHKATDDIRFCENGDNAGLVSDGGMAEYMIGDADNMVHLPNEIDFVQGAPLLCAGATVWAAIQATKVMPGQPIGILGVGGLGTLGVQFAKALGHPVVAIDNRPEGRELATTFPFKADLVVDSNDPDALGTIRKWAGNAGLPALVGCTDHVEVNHWALKLLRPHGVFVPLGLPVEGFKVDAFELIFHERNIVGSLVSTKEQAQQMLNFVAEKGIRSWITEIPMERAGELPELYMNTHLKGRLVLRVL